MIQGLVRRPQQRVQVVMSGSCARNGAATLLATSKGTHLCTVGPGQLVNEHWSRAPSSLLVVPDFRVLTMGTPEPLSIKPKKDGLAGHD